VQIHAPHWSQFSPSSRYAPPYAMPKPPCTRIVVGQVAEAGQPERLADDAAGRPHHAPPYGSGPA
jgi:hypothetical protein